MKNKATPVGVTPPAYPKQTTNLVKKGKLEVAFF